MNVAHWSLNAFNWGNRAYSGFDSFSICTLMLPPTRGLFSIALTLGPHHRIRQSNVNFRSSLLAVSNLTGNDCRVVLIVRLLLFPECEKGEHINCEGNNIGRRSWRWRIQAKRLESKVDWKERKY
jgi:hypothetical protein